MRGPVPVGVQVLVSLERYASPVRGGASKRRRGAGSKGMLSDRYDSLTARIARPKAPFAQGSLFCGCYAVEGELREAPLLS